MRWADLEDAMTTEPSHNNHEVVHVVLHPASKPASFVLIQNPFDLKDECCGFTSVVLTVGLGYSVQKTRSPLEQRVPAMYSEIGK